MTRITIYSIAVFCDVHFGVRFHDASIRLNSDLLGITSLYILQIHNGVYVISVCIACASIPIPILNRSTNHCKAWQGGPPRAANSSLLRAVHDICIGIRHYWSCRHVKGIWIWYGPL